MHFLSFILQLVVGVFSTFMDRHLKDYLWLRCLYMHRYKNRNRTAGETKWNFQKLGRYCDWLSVYCLHYGADWKNTVILIIQSACIIFLLLQCFGRCENFTFTKVGVPLTLAPDAIW